MLKMLARVQLLILDDWGITPLTADQRRDLLEIIDDRHDRASTIVTSQVPVEHWHEHIGNPTIADAVLDRLVHGAHRLELKGDSMRTRAQMFAEWADQPILVVGTHYPAPTAGHVKRDGAAFRFEV
jgi:DNA replication protein DnaC